MIKCSNGSTQLSGSLIDLIQDFVNIISSMRLALTDKLTIDEADKLITFAGELAYASLNNDKTQESEIVLEIMKMMDES